MKKLALAGCALALTGATPLLAQEQAFVWGGEFEIGVDSTVTSDDPAGELTDNYASLSLAFEAGVATRYGADMRALGLQTTQAGAVGSC